MDAYLCPSKGPFARAGLTDAHDWLAAQRLQPQVTFPYTRGLSGRPEGSVRSLRNSTWRVIGVVVVALWLLGTAGCDGGDEVAGVNGGAAGEASAGATSTTAVGGAPASAGADTQPSCECGDRVCGDDGCGGSCGACEGDTAFCFSGTCQTDEACPAVDFTVGEQSAFRMDDKGKERLRYEAVVQGSQFTKLEIVSNRVIEEVGSLGAGTHTLKVENLTGCDDVCVVGHMECNKQECAFPYIATLGTLELTSAGADAQRLVGSASELVFTQAYYDDKTRQYQILKKAESVCMPGFDVDAELEQIIIEPTDCTPEGTGTTLGTEIGDFAMTNCLGETVQFHDNCGYEAVWVVAVADW